MIERNLILRDMSSSSPPQPQNWFENPLSSCMCAADRADTPPNRSCIQNSFVNNLCGRRPARQQSVRTACKTSMTNQVYAMNGCTRICKSAPNVWLLFNQWQKEFPARRDVQLHLQVSW
jgi:hypothetical protein